MRKVVAALLAGAQVASLAAGAHTGHQFAVTESGAATVTIPIQVPRGIAGMEPQLALNYASTSGNGLLGVGWTLSGPSAVTRCPKTIPHDGERGAVTFGPGDRYCLDGQRLRLFPLNTAASQYGTAGTGYRTERDSFSRITAVGSYASGVPSSFKVETKAGLILEFGLETNSRVMTNIPAALGTNTINRWMLQRISDRNQNYVEFVYCGGEVSADGATCTAQDSPANLGTGAWSGSKVLHYIRYTNRGGTPNGTSAVVFGYEVRPDRTRQFHAGSESRQTQRLGRIDTYIGFNGSAVADRGQRVRRYTLSYETLTVANVSQRATNASRLLRVQESNGTDVPGAADQLPALEFTYASDAVFAQLLPQAPAGAVGAAPTQSCGGVAGRYVNQICP